MYFTNISLIFLNHNNSTDTVDRFRLLLNPLQVSPQFLLVQQEANMCLYRSLGPCVLDCPIDPYIILCPPLVDILDRTLTCRTQFRRGTAQGLV